MVQYSTNPHCFALWWLFSASPNRFQMFDGSAPPLISIATMFRVALSDVFSVILMSGSAKNAQNSVFDLNKAKFGSKLDSLNLQ